MGCMTSAPKEVPAVADGKSRLCCAGYAGSAAVGYAKKLVLLVGTSKPERYESFVYLTGPRDNAGFSKFVEETVVPKLSADDAARAKDPKVPLIWLERSDGTATLIGGVDELKTWCQENLRDTEEVKELEQKDPANPDYATKSPGDITSALTSGTSGTAIPK
ncbi:hypothetical protein M885DRAFT_521075 [Pelagophyceae sp. CCMP2097]|nr:hypothetical protein M885DRAFT_521075 [Pelagophyceae sp. CCMP2097]